MYYLSLYYNDKNIYTFQDKYDNGLIEYCIDNNIKSYNNIYNFFLNLETNIIQLHIFILIFQISNDSDKPIYMDPFFEPINLIGYNLCFDENEYLLNIFYELLNIYNTDYKTEINNIYVQQYNLNQQYKNLIHYDNNAFTPHEFLHFCDSKSFALLYQQYHDIFDNIIKYYNLEYYLDTCYIILNNYNEYKTLISNIVKYKPFQDIIGLELKTI